MIAIGNNNVNLPRIEFRRTTNALSLSLSYYQSILSKIDGPNVIFSKSDIEPRFFHHFELDKKNRVLPTSTMTDKNSYLVWLMFNMEFKK